MAVVVWAPVLVQQAVSADGNLGRLADYARSSDRATLGIASALRQIAHTLGAATAAGPDRAERLDAVWPRPPPG